MSDEFKKFMSNDPLRAEQIGIEALELAKAIKYQKGILKITNNLGVLYSGMGDYTRALELLNENLDNYREMGQRKSVANSHNNIGGVYYKMGNLDSALSHYEDALPIFSSLRDTNGVLNILNNLGVIRQDQGRYYESTNAFDKIMRFGEATGDSTLIGAATNNLANLYMRQDRPKDAEKYFIRSQKAFEGLNDKFGLLATKVGLGKVRSMLGDHDACKQLYRESIHMAEELGDLFGLSESYLALSEEYVIMEEYDSALVYSRRAMDISQEIGRTQSEAMGLIFTGRARLAQGNAREAIGRLREALDLCIEFDYRDLERDCYRYLSKAYSEQGEFRKAYEAHDKFFTLHDSIYTLEANNQLSEMQIRYETEKKAKTIGELDQKVAEGESQLDKVTQQMGFFVTSAIILALLVLFFAYRYRSKKRLSDLNRRQRESEEWQRKRLERQNQQIRQINANLEEMVEARTQAVVRAKDELDAFLYQSAHALRRPLLRVEGLVSLLKPKLVDPEDEVLVDKLDETIVGMDALLHKLVKVNEVQRRDPELSSFSFKELVNEVLKGLETEGVEIHHRTTDIDELVSDRTMIQWMLENLIGNSVLYQREGVASSVKVHLEDDEAYFKLVVKDNGRGVPPGEEDRIKQMFYRADVSTSGSGLGLYLVSKIVEKLHGTWEIKSQFDKGTEVVVELPRHML